MRNSLEISHTTHIHTRCDHKLIEKKEEIEKPTCVEILPLITQQGRRKMKKCPSALMEISFLWC